jgi:hypothetical protein
MSTHLDKYMQDEHGHKLNVRTGTDPNTFILQVIQPALYVALDIKQAAALQAILTNWLAKRDRRKNLDGDRRLWPSNGYRTDHVHGRRKSLVGGRRRGDQRD